MPRVLLVLGTRPEAIKLAPLLGQLQQAPQFAVRLCVTGQHRELLDQVLGLFNLVPDVDLNLMQPGQDLTELTAAMLVGLRPVLQSWRPDWTLVQGDTSTALAATIASCYQRVPVGHVEAGLRSGSLAEPFPEELNRRWITAAAQVHFAPTRRAADNLRGEGVSAEKIVVTGNTGIDALVQIEQRLSCDATLAAQVASQWTWLMPDRRLVLVTAHRRENQGHRLEQICQAVRQLAARPDVQVAWPVHPSPAICGPVEAILSGQPQIHLLPPLEYLPFVDLLRRCTLVLTDSGGIQEEAPALGKPVLVLRDTTERTEAVDAGTVRLVGTETAEIVSAASALLDDAALYRQMAAAHSPYGDGHAAERIVAWLQQQTR